MTFRPRKPFKIRTMTTAEKNRVIAEYMCLHFENGCTWENEYPQFMRANFELEYNKSWDWLMPVWQKLRGELVREKYNRALDKDRSTTAMFTIEAIERAIAEDSDITTAHQLIYKAIEQL